MALLAVLVIFVNAAFFAAHAVIGGLARALGVAATGLRALGLSPAATVADWMGRVGARARDDRSAAATLITAAWRRATGREGAVPPRRWLSHTLIGGTVRLLYWPLATAASLGDAVLSTLPTARWASAVGRGISRALRPAYQPGVLECAVGDLAVARTQFGFFVMLASGSDTIRMNFQGMCGGMLAVLLGDPDWLAEGMRRLRAAADYVHEKERQGELGPRARMPFSRAMVQSTADVLDAYPAEVVEVMATRGFLEGARAYWRDRARVHRVLALYFVFTAYTLRDVSRFFTRGLLDAPDAQRLTLCELAVMASPLPDDQKDLALLDVQATAPSAIVEFEHYVGLVRPWDGTLADKAIRRSASGAPLDTGTVVPSILDRHAVHVAQSTNAEAYALRTFLWLYRDETRARDVGARETARKFGPAVAARLGREPLYPLEAWEVDALTAGGPRPEAEVEAILLDALRGRGLGAVAERIRAARA